MLQIFLLPFLQYSEVGPPVVSGKPPSSSVCTSRVLKISKRASITGDGHFQYSCDVSVQVLAVGEVGCYLPFSWWSQISGIFFGSFRNQCTVISHLKPTIPSNIWNKVLLVEKKLETTTACFFILKCRQVMNTVSFCFKIHLEKPGEKYNQRKHFLPFIVFYNINYTLFYVCMYVYMLKKI